MDGEGPLGDGGEGGFDDAVGDADLLFAGDVHDVEGEEFAGDAREGDVEVDFHFLACDMFLGCSSFWRIWGETVRVTSSFVDNELRHDDDSPVVGPFAPYQP